MATPNHLLRNTLCYSTKHVNICLSCFHLSLVLQISLLTVFIHISCPVVFNCIALFVCTYYNFLLLFPQNYQMNWTKLDCYSVLGGRGGLVTSAPLDILLTKNLSHKTSQFPVLPRLWSAHFVYQHTHFTHASGFYASPTKFHKPSSSGLLVTAIKLNSKRRILSVVFFILLVWKTPH